MTADTDDLLGKTWVDAELEDSFDEELEMEIDDERVRKELRHITDARQGPTIARRTYFRELLRLQAELVKLQDWVAYTTYKLVVIFEGRDSADKGGVIKRITQRLNQRIYRVVALPAPSEREKTQWYFERYVPHLPAGGEIVLFDRSWYNRVGVERVMGFATPDQVKQFFHNVPEFERMLVRSGVKLVKYWFSITDQEQQLRFLMRIYDPLKQKGQNLSYVNPSDVQLNLMTDTIDNSYATLSEVALGLQFGKALFGIGGAASIPDIQQFAEPEALLQALACFILALPADWA